MTTTLDPPRRRTSTSKPDTAAPVAGRRRSPKIGSPARRRRHGRIGVGLVLIVLSVLGATTLIARGQERQQVLVTARTVPPGAVLTVEDLATADLPVDTGLAAVGVDDLDAVVGQFATVGIPEGSLLLPSHLSPEARVPPGLSLVGAVLDAGQFPVGLMAGDRVELVIGPAPGAVDAEAVPVLLGTGEVRELAEPTTGAGALVVSLLVPSEIAQSAATAGPAGRLSLVVVAER